LRQQLEGNPLFGAKVSLESDAGSQERCNTILALQSLMMHTIRIGVAVALEQTEKGRLGRAKSEQRLRRQQQIKYPGPKFRPPSRQSNPKHAFAPATRI